MPSPKGDVIFDHRHDAELEACRRTVAYRPDSLTQVLTEHYRRIHPEALCPSSR
jgi:hypothetical protein